MQDRDQLQKEIDAVKLQLSIADMSAMTASPEEKEHWDARRESLKERLANLQKNLEENVVYDGSNAASILDDATADAMLNEILSAEEEPAPVSESDDPDEMLSRILQQTEKPVAAQSGDMPFEREDTSRNEHVDNILFTSDEDDPSALDTQAADALLNELLAQDTPEKTAQEHAQAATENEDTDRMREETQPIVVGKSPAESEQTTGEREEHATLTQEESASVTGTPDPTVAVPLFADTPSVRFTPSPAEDYDSEIDRLRKEAEEANRKAQAALAEAERMRREAEEIRLAAETERAMYAAEIELQRGLRAREDSMRNSAEQAEKDKLAEKIARRKAEISALRNELQNIKDSESAFALREKLLAVQLVFDEDERSNAELSYLLTKTIDDVAHMLEVVELKRKIAALVAAKKAAPKAVKRKPAAKKAAPKKKKKTVSALAHRRRPPLRAASRRRPAPRYR